MGSLFDYQYDGMTFGYHVTPKMTARVCYGVGYSAGFGNGNLLNGGTRSYTWDRENHIASVTSAGVQESYSYDADGERVTTTRSASTTVYLEGLWEEVADRRGEPGRDRDARQCNQHRTCDSAATVRCCHRGRV